MNITLNQLRVFRVIAEKKSITKAAEELNMTQPAVSIQLKKMQDQFDIPLTEMINRKVFVTNFGLEVCRMAERVMAEMEDIRDKAAAHKGILAGKLSVSVVSTGKYILPHFLSGFLQSNPAVELRVDVTNRTRVIESLEENEVDFSLVSVPPSRLQVMEEMIMPNRWYLVAPKNYPLPDRRRLDKSVFARIPLIFREEGSGTRYIMQQYFKQAGIVPHISLELASDEAVKQAVIAGLGLSILSILTLKNELKQKEVKIVPVRGLPLKSSWRLIWLKRKKASLIAQAYLDYIRREKVAIFREKFAWMEEVG
jgi:DNA-binding transcriptional LysR family regulator